MESTRAIENRRAGALYPSVYSLHGIDTATVIRVAASKIQRCFRHHVARTRADFRAQLIGGRNNTLGVENDSNKTLLWPTFLETRSRPRTPILDKVSWEFIWDVYIDCDHDEVKMSRSASLLQALFRGAQGRRRAQFRKISSHLKLKRRAQQYAMSQSRVLSADATMGALISSLRGRCTSCGLLRAISLDSGCLLPLHVRQSLRRYPSLRQLLHPRWYKSALKIIDADNKRDVSLEKLKCYYYGYEYVPLPSPRLTSPLHAKLLPEDVVWQRTSDEYSLEGTIPLLWKPESEPLASLLTPAEMKRRQERRIQCKKQLLPADEYVFAARMKASEPEAISEVQSRVADNMRLYFPVDYHADVPHANSCRQELENVIECILCQVEHDVIAAHESLVHAVVVELVGCLVAGIEAKESVKSGTESEAIEPEYRATNDEERIAQPSFKPESEMHNDENVDGLSLRQIRKMFGQGSIYKRVLRKRKKQAASRACMLKTQPPSPAVEEKAATVERSITTVPAKKKRTKSKRKRKVRKVAPVLSVDEMLDWAEKRPRQKKKLKLKKVKDTSKTCRRSRTPPNTASRLLRVQEPLRKLDDLKEKQKNERKYVTEMTRMRLNEAKDKLANITYGKLDSSPALLQLKSFIDESENQEYLRRLHKLQRSPQAALRPLQKESGKDGSAEISGSQTSTTMASLTRLVGVSPLKETKKGVRGLHSSLKLGERIQKLHGAYTQSSGPNDTMFCKIPSYETGEEWKNGLYRRAWAHSLSKSPQSR